MTLAQIKKQEKKVELLNKRASRAQLELNVAQSEWDIAHGNFKVLKTSADIKSFVKKLR